MNKDEAIELRNLASDNDVEGVLLDEDEADIEEDEEPLNVGVGGNETESIRLRHVVRVRSQFESDEAAAAEVRRPLLERGGNPDDTHVTESSRRVKRVRYSDLDGGDGDEASPIERENLLASTSAANDSAFQDTDLESGAHRIADEIDWPNNGSVLVKLVRLVLIAFAVFGTLLLILVALPNCIFRLEYNEVKEFQLT